MTLPTIKIIENERHKIKDIVEGITGTLFCLVLFAMFSCTSDRDQYGENLEIIDFGIVQQTRATDSSLRMVIRSVFML